MEGINIIGYARAESGLGEACRCAARALQAADIPFCMINFSKCSSRQNDFSWKHKEVNMPIFNTNLIFINADQLYEQFKLKNIPIEWFEDRYNIGYWHWELPEFPSEWMPSLDLVDELWVPSAFTASSISPKTSKPVHIVPHSISLDTISSKTRRHYGLHEGQFLFMAMVDFLSTSARKNPYAAIEAFKKAFQPNDQSVGLVLKVNNAARFPHELKKLKETIHPYKNMFVVKRPMNRADVNGLISLSDSLISLHRAEGFGLPLAEAMFLGKPVIATNWSGNTDFMNEENSCLIDYSLTETAEDSGPYARNQLWADADIDQAVYFMKKISRDKEFAKKIGDKGRNTIVQELSPAAIGEIYIKRLSQMKRPSH